MRLMSPEYDLEAFCNHLRGTDPLAVIDAASTEIGHVHRLHRETTEDSDAHKTSKADEYCENLQRLISMLMNGSVPVGSTPQFIDAVKTLVRQLLQKWEIGNLRRVFSNLRGSESLNLPDTIDPLVIVISRSEVEALDISAALGVLKKLTESPDTARKFVERVDIAFHGYDHTQEELFDIPAVRNFVHELDRQFPFWFYFLSKRHFGLQCLLLCLIPPFLTEEARSGILPKRINRLLTTRWFPAMNHICEYVGFTEKQNERLTHRALAYITTGRFPLDSEPFG